MGNKRLLCCNECTYIKLIIFICPNLTRHNGSCKHNLPLRMTNQSLYTSHSLMDKWCKNDHKLHPTSDSELNLHGTYSKIWISSKITKLSLPWSLLSLLLLLLQDKNTLFWIMKILHPGLKPRDSFPGRERLLEQREIPYNDFHMCLYWHMCESSCMCACALPGPSSKGTKHLRKQRPNLQM